MPAVIISNSVCDMLVQIYDGANDDSAVLAKVCANVIPPPVFTDANAVKVKFFTDGTVHKKGYVITYFASPGILQPRG